MTSFLNGFVSGFLFATILYSCILMIFGRIMRARLKKRIEELKTELDKNPNLFNDSLKGKIKKYIEEAEQMSNIESKKESIQSRLLEAQEITRQQLDLRAEAEMPSMNSAHSKYKNSLIYEIQKLEEEKINILESILKDGYDPVVSTINEYGETNQIKLSDFIAKSRLSFEDDTAQESQPESDSEEQDIYKPKKVGKFFLIRGGKDDGGGN